MSMVDLPTGRVSLSQIDFEIPGQIPIIFKRHYRSTNIWQSDLGYGWSHPFGVRLWLENKDLIFFRGPDGRRIPFSIPKIGEPVVQPSEKMALYIIPTKELPWDDLQKSDDTIFMIQRSNQFTLFFKPIVLNNRYPLIGIADGNQNLLKVFFGKSGLPSRIDDPRGRTLFFFHNDLGYLTKILISETREFADSFPIVNYQYDLHGDLSVVEVGTKTYHYKYKDHRLVQYQDPLGRVTYIEYDNKGRCKLYSNLGGVLKRQYKYDLKKNLTTVYDSLNHPAYFTFSDMHTIIKSVDREGGISYFDYDANNRLIQTTDQMGYETGICPDMNGGQAGKIRADGSFTEIESDSNGLIKKIISAGGAETEYIRDDKGRVVELKLPQMGCHQIAYDSDGSINQIKFSNGNTVKYEWGSDGRVLTETDNYGLVGKYYFNLFGWLLKKENAEGAVTQYTYDEAGQLAKQFNSDGSNRNYRFNPAGQLEQLRDESGSITQWKYDDAGRRTKVTLPSGDIIHCKFDTENRLLDIQYAGDLIHSYEYDKRGLVKKQIFSDGRTEQYGYDDRGLLIQIIDSVGRNMDIERNAVGEPTQIIFPDRSKKKIYYDDDNRWIRIEHGENTLERQLTPEGFPVIEYQNNYYIKREFGDNGLIQSVVDDLGRKVLYKYDKRNRSTQIQVINGQWINEKWEPTTEPFIHAFKFDKLGNWIQWEMPSGKVEQRTYDLNNRLVKQVISYLQKTIIRRVYTYDSAGRVLVIDDSLNGSSHYTYDNLNRIKTAKYGDQPEKELDYGPYGDLISNKMHYSNPHQVSGCDGHRLEYDQQGYAVLHTSPRGATKLSYNPVGLIQKAEFSNGTSVSYEYDPAWRWTKKSMNNEVWHYYWNGERLWACHKENSEPVHYLYLPGHWTPFEQQEGEKHFSIHTDHMGKVLELIDEKGMVVWKNQTGIWGEGRSLSSTDIPECVFGFPGQIYDSTTGYYYNRYRFYAAEFSHYLTPDPSGIWGGLNVYNYVYDPINQMDPLGLECRNKTDDPALYRGDRRPPEAICKDGFKPHNPQGNFELVDHVNGANQNSQWVSTSHDLKSAQTASSFGTDYDKDIGPRAGRWVYEIENPGCGQEVDCDPKVIAHEQRLKDEHGIDSSSEHEIAFNKAIPPGNIVGAVNLDTGEMVMCP